MVLRIASDAELKRLKDEKTLGASAATRIEAELKAIDARPGRATQRRKKGKPRRPQSEAELHGLEACTLPPVMPADILYQALVRRWGRFATGGEVVWELEPFTDSRYRLDTALPRFRCGVEMDGWQYHGKTLEGFQKSRAKQMFFCRRGWLFFQVSNDQVRNELDDVIEAVAEGLSYQVRREVSLKRLPAGWSRIIEET